MDNKPITGKTYPVPIAYRDEVERSLEQMLDAGIMRREITAYVNLVVIVKKEDGTIRIYLDARKINGISVPAYESPPKINNILVKFQGD